MNNLSYNTLLQKEATKRKWTPSEVGVFENWRYNVGQVESNNIPSRKQGDKASGIGRGKYQYEMKSKNGSGSNVTAVSRLNKYLQKNGFSLDDLPETDVKELLNKNPDFSKLSEDTQDIIFLADKTIAPEAKLDDLVKNKISLGEAWADWHWKGSSSERNKKLQQFASNYKEFKPEQTQPVQTPMAVAASDQAFDEGKKSLMNPLLINEMMIAP